MKEVFLFLSSTKTRVSKTVSFLTRSRTTHSALCLNGKFDYMYTFGRKTLTPFPAGFVHENIRTNILHAQNSCKCAVYRLKISDEAFQSMQKEIEVYEKEIDKYKYALLGAWLCLFRLKSNFKYKRFCSQFVANLLHDGAGLELPYHTSKMRPKDFLKLPNLTKVFEGTIKDLEEGLDSGALNFKTIK